MNFAAVQQAGGTNVIMIGQIVEFKGEGVGKTGKPWKKVVVEDMERERHTVTIRGNLPPVDALNKSAQFTLSVYDGTTYQGQPYVGYSGFCDVLPNYNQQSPAPPLRQPAPQSQYPRQQQQSPAPPYPRRQQSPPQKAPNWEAKDERIVRQNTLNRSVELYIQSDGDFSWPIDDTSFVQICLLAEKFRDYVYGGTNQSPKQTFKQAAQDAFDYRDKRQAQINAEQDAGEDIPY